MIAAEQEAMKEAARPKVTIDFSGLEKIRLDAGATRESLLTEEEREEAETPSPPVNTVPAAEPSAAAGTLYGLDGLHSELLRALCRGDELRETIRENHLMPSVVVDTINEALFDALGDSALSFDGTQIRIVEEYREELKQMLGG